MPKEITHWIASMKTAEALHGSLFGDAASDNVNALQFGAIFPDILFNLPGTRKMDPYRNISSSLHGINGEDTYQQIRYFTASLQDQPYRKQLLAFLLGVVTHIMTDRVFHPMIYYLTGNTRHGEPSKRSDAIQQHHRFESLMDLYFCGKATDVKKSTTKSILKNLKNPAPQIIELSLQAMTSNATLPDINNIFERALKNFRILHTCYRCRPLARFLCSLTPFASNSAREFIALFYPPQLDRMLPYVSGELRYRNPMTGAKKNNRLDDLLEEAVTQSVLLARTIEEKITAGTMSSFLERGPALTYGAVSAANNQALHFAEKPFFSQDRS